MALITQIIIAVITFCIMLMKEHFYKIKEQEGKKNNDERNEEKIKKYEILSSLFGKITIAGVLYFIFYLITSTPWTFWNVVLACVKMIIFGLIFTAILYDGNTDDLDDNDIEAIVVITAVACIIIVAGIGIHNGIQNYKYEKNIVVNEEIQYTKQEYKLSKEFNVTNSENDEIFENSVSEYFDYEVSRYSDGDIYSRKYSICYVDKKGDLIFKELDDDNTKLIALKKDETPYLEIKTYTKYGMDNNKNPPEQILVKEEVEYVLHILQEDIDKVLKLENKE